MSYSGLTRNVILKTSVAIKRSIIKDGHPPSPPPPILRAYTRVKFHFKKPKVRILEFCLLRIMKTLIIFICSLIIIKMIIIIFILICLFNAFHTVVLKINLLETVKHNKYIGHRIQGVL